MGKVVLDISMSLDGFVAAAERTAAEPLGQGGQRLHEWVMHEAGQNLLQEAGEDLGAVIAGRVTYDASVPWWGADGPTGPARKPVFVLTHLVPDSRPENAVHTFVTSGVEVVLEQAQRAAGGKTVCVMGGANVAQQFLAAGLVDEISIHLAPIVLGRGLRLFDESTQL